MCYNVTDVNVLRRRRWREAPEVERLVLVPRSFHLFP